jgi:hypothetical protein
MYGNSKQTLEAAGRLQHLICCVTSGHFLLDLFSAVVSLLQYFVLEAKFCNEAGIVEHEICHCEV